MTDPELGFILYIFTRSCPSPTLQQRRNKQLDPMDCCRQHCVQLAGPLRDSLANVTPTKQPNDDAAHLLISMYPSLYRAVYSGRAAEVMELLLHQKGAARDGKAAAGKNTHEVPTLTFCCI